MKKRRRALANQVSCEYFSWEAIDQFIIPEVHVQL